QFHRVAGLVLGDPDIVGSELISPGRNHSLDLVSVRSADFHSGVVALNAQVGLAGGGVSLGPLLGLGQRNKTEQPKYNRNGFQAHTSPPAPQTSHDTQEAGGMFPPFYWFEGFPEAGLPPGG